jgi:hypothetical protein
MVLLRYTLRLPLTEAEAAAAAADPAAAAAAAPGRSAPPARRYKETLCSADVGADDAASTLKQLVAASLGAQAAHPPRLLGPRQCHCSSTTRRPSGHL